MTTRAPFPHAPKNESLLAWAIYYAKRKWPVFPLWPGGKKPRIGRAEGGRGLYDATTDEKQIRKWWRRWPEANIGINCGAAGWVVVDVDFKPEQGVTGFETWRELREQLNVPDDTLTSMTPTGGVHIIYANKNGSKVTNAAGHRLGEGIDVRGSGGYIVAPPSAHPGGGKYAWELSGHPEDTRTIGLPDALRDLMVAEAKGQRQPAAPIGDTISDGTRNETLTSLAGTMRRRGMGEAEIAAALLITNEQRCDPPLLGRDIERIAKSVCRYEPQDRPVEPAPPNFDTATVPKPTKGTPTIGWRVRTMKDAFAPRPPRTWAIDGLFGLPSLNIAYGSPGGFKSFILADAGMCVATGTPWLQPNPRVNDGFIPRPVRPGTALWCDFDNGRRRTDERTEALGRAYGASNDTPFLYVSMPTPWLSADSPLAIAAFANCITNYGAQFVVVDNLGVVSGNVDENSAEMARVLGVFRNIAENTGAAITIIHHQRKTSMVTARAGESLRGSSSIEAAIDLGLRIVREQGTDKAILKSTKTRDTDVYPFGVQFAYEHKSGTDDLLSARFFGRVIANESTSNKVLATIYAAVKQSPGCIQQELLTMVKRQHKDVGVNRIHAIIQAAEQAGQVTVRPGSKNSKRYYSC